MRGLCFWCRLFRAPAIRMRFTLLETLLNLKHLALYFHPDKLERQFGTGKGKLSCDDCLPTHETIRELRHPCERMITAVSVQPYQVDGTP